MILCKMLAYDFHVPVSKKEFERLELLKSNLQIDLKDRVITSHDYQDMKGRVDKDIVLIKDKFTELQQEVSPLKVYLHKEVPMLENILEYYTKSEVRRPKTEDRS